jgi:entericidin B
MSAMFQQIKEGLLMSHKSLFALGAVLLSVVAFGGCANTIRGAGQDTANAVNATQDAGNRVGNAASY